MVRIGDRRIQEAAPGLLHSSTHLWRSLVTSILHKYHQKNPRRPFPPCLQIRKRCVGIVSMTNESRISPMVSCQPSKQLDLKVAKQHKALLHVPHIRCICSCNILKVLASLRQTCCPGPEKLCDVLWRQQVIQD